MYAGSFIRTERKKPISITSDRKKPPFLTTNQKLLRSHKCRMSNCPIKCVMKIWIAMDLSFINVYQISWQTNIMQLCITLWMTRTVGVRSVKTFGLLISAFNLYIFLDIARLSTGTSSVITCLKLCVRLHLYIFKTQKSWSRRWNKCFKSVRSHYFALYHAKIWRGRETEMYNRTQQSYKILCNLRVMLTK